MPICYNCGQSTFSWEDGVYICQGCLHVLPGEQQYEQDCLLTQTQTSRIVTVRSQEKSNDVTPNKVEWIIYDGFNLILAHMTKSLIECGVKNNIRNVVIGLWAAYLRNLQVAFLKRDAAEKNEENECESSEDGNQEDSLQLPQWMLSTEKSQINPSKQSGNVTETEFDTDYKSTNEELPFTPIKVSAHSRKRKRRKRKSKHEDLLSLPDSELSARERSRKKSLIKNKFLSQSASILESGVEDSDTDGGEIDCSASTTTKSGYSRRHSLIDKMPECFPEAAVSEKSFGAQRIAEFPSSKTVLTDPEYLTLSKLLSFLHGALLLLGEEASQSDLIRWIREGWIPFHGSHKLLPPDTMPLSRTDSSILGGVCQKNAWVAPLSSGMRRNTAKLLVMLGVPEIKLPPIDLVAEKIIQDLQLPDECVRYIRALERLVFPSRGWKTKKIGDSIPSVESHAAAFLLVVMKLLFGLDGTSEFQISEFTEKANQILKLERSSALPHPGGANPPVPAKPSVSSIKTLFNWEEWVRWIRYRRFILDRNHVPTAIRHHCVSRMDPDYVLRYAESHGHQLSHPKKPSKITVETCEEVSRILDEYIQQHGGPDLSKKIPTFKPCRLPVQGLAEQLIEFDPDQFKMLKQSFPSSTMEYLIDQQPLAEALRSADRPTGLKICHGPAFSNVELHTPFVRRQKKQRAKLPPLQSREIQLKAGPIALVGTLSDDDDDSSQPLPSLLLHLPSSAYWSLSAATDQSKEAWELVASQLPSTFLWLLELICESIEEEPYLVYQHIYVIETIIFQRNGKLLHTLSDPQDLKRRLVSALLSDINRR